MNKLITLLSLITLSTTTFAQSINDFTGDFKLSKGAQNCYKILTIETSNEGNCLSLSPKNPDMNWSPTDKICNVNGGVIVSEDDIPAPMFIGTIKHTSESSIKDTIVATDMLTSISLQQTFDQFGNLQYEHGRTTYLNMTDENTLNYNHMTYKVEVTNGEDIINREARHCIYTKK